MDFKIKMIRIKDHEVSEKYANYCAKSWTDNGFDVEFYDAVTPATLDDQKGVMFGRKGRPIRNLTRTERACYYSQFNLWRECARTNTPYLILEHDAYLEKPEVIKFRPEFTVQYFGQHAMEAVMYHPDFAKDLVLQHQKQSVVGPMNTVDNLVGYNAKPQARHAWPHARFLGPQAPVRSVIDPTIGTTVMHHNLTHQRVTEEGEADLFKVVRIR